MQFYRSVSYLFINFKLQQYKNERVWISFKMGKYFTTQQNVLLLLFTELQVGPLRSHTDDPAFENVLSTGRPV